MRQFAIPLLLLVAVIVIAVVMLVIEQRPPASTAPSEPAATKEPATPISAADPVAAVGAATPSTRSPPTAPVAIPAVPTERHVVALTDGWLFTIGDAHRAHEVLSGDPAWQSVTVPHSWNVADGSDGGSYYRGIGWYRRWLEVPETERGRSIFVSFGAANISATVFVNSVQVAKHDGGFAAFTIDITSQVRFGARNLIAVKVTNGENLGLPPLYADFTFNGGLYRGVTAISTSPLHFELATHGWTGVHVHQRAVNAELAELDVELAVRNDTAAVANADVVVEVLDTAGMPVASVSAPVAVPPRQTTTVNVPVRIAHPHRWHGRKDPYQYQAVARIRSGGAVIDEVRRPLGVRAMRIDPAQGFLLNGEPYDLHGVCLHQDRLGKGWLASTADRQEDVALLLELGATFVRLVHYQHDQEVYDLMDRAGIVVWTELPVLMQVGRQPQFAVSAKTQLAELIRQNAHHPSIVCWGLYNEIGSEPTDVALITELHALAKQLDPTRPTAGSSYLVDAATINGVTEVISFNKYFGWFLPNIDHFGPWADGFHRAYPQRAVGLTEYGAAGSITRHEEKPTAPIPGLAKVVPGNHSEEYHALFHETVWPQLASRPFLWCKALWVLCDYASDGRKDADAPGYCDMGLVTGDRKTRKDAFYYYQAQWSDLPVLHLTGRRFRERVKEVEVKVYANATGVAVKVNGVALPTVTGAGGVCRWPGVMLKTGTNVIEARGTHAGKTISDRVEWIVR